MRIVIADNPRNPNEVVNYIYAFKELGVADIYPTLDPKKLEEADGMILPGSACDINPALWGEENTHCDKVNDELDAGQKAMLDKAIELGIPVIGMCRGIQFINVYFGGSLIQHLNAFMAHRYYVPDRYHRVIFEEGSFLKELYGKDELMVNSRHHQAVGRIGKGLKCIARWEPSPSEHPQEDWESVTTEALQHETLPIIGLQWHPERSWCMDYDQKKADGEKLLLWFMNLCEETKAKRQAAK